MNLIFYISYLLVTLYVVFTTKGKPESDRQEALELCRSRVLSKRNPVKTSQGNPMTTGIFSIVISLPFRDLRYLTAIFWVWFYYLLYANDINVVYVFLLLPFILRTALYRLEEVYFILIPLHYALTYFGFWGLSVLVLWRDFTASFDVVTTKKLNKRSLVLDYILLPTILLM